MLDTDPLWYKDAIIYEAHVKSFFDSTNDGIGDFRGFTSKLDYLQDLGITCLWLLPFYPSPLRDDGYDIADYRNVHPSYGTLEDFKALVDAAHARGIRVLTELVVNHTSDQHPWFQAARHAPCGSREREFYVWSDTDQRFPETRIIFTDTEQSNWTFDKVAGQYYWHRFFTHQPDLNHNNPEVVEAVIDVMRFWLDLGVDALRLDAVPYLCVREGTNNENLPETHAVLKQMRRAIDEYPGRMLLAEANQWPADVRPYFGDGDESHMAFHFPLMPRIFMAVRQEDRHPITEIMRQTPEIPPSCQWALFLRNHDELTLEMVTDEERDYMYNAYAADPMMRLNVGIRRRLAPLMENSRRRVELLNILLFTLPGTPVIYYGDEIGMGDNIYLGDRNGVRTPMQWSGDRNAGFSRADPAKLYAPPIMDPVYGYQSINVEAQERYPFSLLNWMKRLIGLRKRHTVFGRGTLEFVDCSNRKVLAYIRRDEQETMLIVLNLARTSQPAAIDLRAFAGLVPVESFGDTEFPRIGEQPYMVTLMPYGYLMFRLQHAVESVSARPVPVEAPAEAIEARPALLAGVAWDTMLDGALRRYLEREALPTFLPRQRWFGRRTATIASVRLIDWALLRAGSQPVFLTIAEAAFTDGSSARYFLPMATVTGAEAERVAREAPGAVVARITGARKGLLIDAVLDDHACGLLLDAIAQQRDLATQLGVVRGRQTTLWLPDAPQDVASVSRGGAEQSNSSVRFGARKILKLFRRLDTGVNPELEIGRHLAAAGFPRVPPFAGWFEYDLRQGEPTTLGILQGLVHNQGDAWDGMLAELGHYFDRAAGDGRPVSEELLAGDVLADSSAEPPEFVRAAIGIPLTAAATLGLRTAEMHMALAASADDTGFEPEPLDAEHMHALVERVAAHARAQLVALESASTPEAIRPLVERVRGLAADVNERVRRLAPVGRAGARIRVHGDYHLGQLLWSEQDFYILDFEGEPARSLAERRAKESPLKDVAGMLRSLSYAATAGLLAFERRQPGSLPALESWALLWERWIGAAFLGAYRRMLGGSELLPQTEDFVGLLALFTLEKAFYELGYEMNNRPEWLRIPLLGVAHLLGD